MAFVPAALLSPFVVGVVLHFGLFLLSVSEGKPVPESTERFLQPVLGAFAIVWVGAMVAPENHLKIAVFLASTYIVMVVITVFVVGGGKSFGNIEIEPHWFRQFFCICSAAAAVYTVSRHPENWR